MHPGTYDYIVYIDEAGDDGLKRVRPIDELGSSEWLMLSAVVVSASRENEVTSWVSDIRNSLHRHNRPDIHFAKLSETKKLKVCRQMSGLDARYFVLASNKKNMRGYSNPLPEKIPSKNWFYCWLTRLLLERVSHWIKMRSLRDFGEPRRFKIEFSQRGGLSYGQLKAYLEWLHYQGDDTWLPLGKLDWSVMPDHRLIKVYNHTERAGLQLADCVASSFFKAADVYSTGACDPRFAKALEPRMARPNDRVGGQISGYGLKLMPNWKTAKLTSEQQEIFKYYGYPLQWWDPDSFNR